MFLRSPAPCWHFGWLVGWNMNGLFFHSVGNFILPTDELSIIFQRGRSTTKQIFIAFNIINQLFLWENHLFNYGHGMLSTDAFLRWSQICHLQVARHKVSPPVQGLRERLPVGGRFRAWKRCDPLPSGNLLHSYWKWPIYSGFSHWKWWFSIAMGIYYPLVI